MPVKREKPPKKTAEKENSPKLRRLHFDISFLQRRTHGAHPDRFGQRGSFIRTRP